MAQPQKKLFASPISRLRIMAGSRSRYLVARRPRASTISSLQTPALPCLGIACIFSGAMSGTCRRPILTAIIGWRTKRCCRRYPCRPGTCSDFPLRIQDAAAVAKEYESTLRKFFQLEPGQLPRFDLILLGMGPDGHTASLFPGTAGLQEKSRLVIANWVEKLKTHRLTFTLPVLNAARSVAFLVSGTDKAPVLKAVLEEEVAGEQYPAKLVQPTDGKLIWFLDRAAASGLSLQK